MLNQIVLQQVSKSFWQGPVEFKVLDQVSISFSLNHNYALLGRSGSGKSTLIHLLAGTELPDAGQIYWGEQGLGGLNSNQRAKFWNQQVGLVFQQANLIAELTVLENVMLKGLIAGQDRQIVQAQAFELLDQVGLSPKISSAPGYLSRGEQQRVAIVRALMGRPKMVLADEPTASLDAQTGQKIIELLLDLHYRYQVGLIISTHDQQLSQMMDTRLYLESGTLQL